MKKKVLSEVGFEPTPSYEDQNSLSLSASKSPWVWRLRPLGHPDYMLQVLLFSILFKFINIFLFLFIKTVCLSVEKIRSAQAVMYRK